MRIAYHISLRPEPVEHPALTYTSTGDRLFNRYIKLENKSTSRRLLYECLSRLAPPHHITFATAEASLIAMKVYNGKN